MKFRESYATPTRTVIRRIISEGNPVTRASYIDILGSRIDRLEMHRLKQLETCNDSDKA